MIGFPHMRWCYTVQGTSKSSLNQSVKLTAPMTAIVVSVNFLFQQDIADKKQLELKNDKGQCLSQLPNAKTKTKYTSMLNTHLIYSESLPDKFRMCDSQNMGAYLCSPDLDGT